MKIKLIKPNGQIQIKYVKDWYELEKEAIKCERWEYVL